MLSSVRSRSSRRSRMSHSSAAHESAVVGGLIGTINNAKTTRAGAERARQELKINHGVAHPPKRKWTTDLKRLLHIGTGHHHSTSHAGRRY